MALIEASEGGDLDEVRRLLDAGADRDAVDEYSMSAAHFAAREGHLEIVQLLRARGANLDGRDGAGLTPFLGQHSLCAQQLVACQRGKYPVTRNRTDSDPLYPQGHAVVAI